ncbi:MAG: sulfate reduction electron transfer complex DsrMKJOP subunit DsrM [Desulfobacterales bacterium]
MSVNYIVPLLSVIALSLIAYVGAGVEGLQIFFGVSVPYVAAIIFTAGVAYRMMEWAKSPVPFRIPTTTGQAKSLPWIKESKIDNPSTTLGVIVRMLLEVLFFRSLLRNTKFISRDGGKASYGMELWLWLGALAFHYTFVVVLVRHFRFFLEPVPGCIQLLGRVDGFLQVGLPGVFVSGIVLLVAVTYLLLRRLFIPHVRYISLAADYFPLFLIMGIAISGILMRHFLRTDVPGIKTLAMGIVTFHPVVPKGIGAIFYVHLFFVSVLVAYLPFSKLMHMGGIFLSPTRNLANNSRMKRHVNPWNYPVTVHTYDAYEDEYREKMIEAGIPVEKE